MTVKELIDELSKFDSNLDIEFEFEEYNADGGTWILEPGVFMKFSYEKENKEALIFNFRNIGRY